VGVRIVAGSFGGRRLEAPAGTATRPTSDRVKEALFSILGPIEGATVVDLFAGSGALGLEALSRGAESATFVESDRKAADTIRRNVASLGCSSRATLIVDRAERSLARLPPKIDLLLMDPPYATLSSVMPLIDRLAVSGALPVGARVCVEHRTGDAPRLERVALSPARVYGDTSLSFGIVSS
jgi:16S rRNA (guanine(966)-N(2))-methyltransferase RsmD